MKDCNLALFCFLATILATFFNFPAIIMGGSISFLNIAATCTYIVSWIMFVLHYKKSLTAMVISMMWGSLIAFISVWAPTTIFLEIQSKIALIMVPLLLTPLHGVSIISKDFLYTYIITFLFGLVLVFLSFTGIYRIKHDRTVS